MSNISAWSSTAASNNSASPNGFPEGMLPSGVNDSCREIMAGVRSWYESAEWINRGHAPTFVSTVSFTIPTDVMAIYHVGRRMRFTDATTLYGTIATSTYSAPNTTIEVTMDSGVLSSSLSAVSVSILSSTNSPIPTTVTSQIPAGSITAWNPGYYTNGLNAGYTFALGSANTVAAANAYLNPLGYYVCDGAALNDSRSVIFNGASRYLPNLTDSRFLMGSTAAGAGAATGSNTLRDHTHTSSLTAAGQTHAGNSGSVSDPGTHTHNMAADNSTSYGGGPYVKGNLGNVTVIATGGAGAHSHTVALNHTHAASAVSGTIGTGAVAGSTENRPLFLSCFYIMKVR